VALSSADLILGVKGSAHPLGLFLQHGVPVALTTDDLGVSRASHTREWVKAVQEQNLDYPALKRLARNSIDFAFADTATRTRLKQDLETELRRFEQRQAAAWRVATR
jgi:adenosine deaminase